MSSPQLPGTCPPTQERTEDMSYRAGRAVLDGGVTKPTNKQGSGMALKAVP